MKLESQYKWFFWGRVGGGGFTLIEVLVATVIMVILCAGTLAVFSHASRINSGNNVRAQAQSVLQQDVEYYRSLKFIPSGMDSNLIAGNHTLSPITAADGEVFTMSSTVTNVAYVSGQPATEANCVFKEIRIVATPPAGQPAWLANLSTVTQVTIQRVRAN